MPRQVRALGARWRLLDTVDVESFVVAPASQVPGNLSGEHAVNSVGRSLGPVVSLVWLLNHDLCADDAPDGSPACASTCMPTRGSVSLHLITLHAASSSCGYGQL